MTAVSHSPHPFKGHCLTSVHLVCLRFSFFWRVHFFLFLFHLRNLIILALLLLGCWSLFLLLIIHLSVFCLLFDIKAILEYRCLFLDQSSKHLWLIIIRIVIINTTFHLICITFISDFSSLSFILYLAFLFFVLYFLDFACLNLFFFFLIGVFIKLENLNVGLSTFYSLCLRRLFFNCEITALVQIFSAFGAFLFYNANDWNLLDFLRLSNRVAHHFFLEFLVFSSKLWGLFCHLNYNELLSLIFLGFHI